MAPSTLESSSTRPATDVDSTPAIPATITIASTGSCRASAAAGESSRSATKTPRGLWKIESARSHHSRWSEGEGVCSAAVLTR